MNVCKKQNIKFRICPIKIQKKDFMQVLINGYFTENNLIKMLGGNLIEHEVQLL